MNEIGITKKEKLSDDDLDLGRSVNQFKQIERRFKRK